MKKLTIAIFAFAVWLALESCEKPSQEQNTGQEELKTLAFDSIKALEYGADDYGMKRYVMAFLKRGDNRSLDSLQAMELQRKHLQNIEKMAENGDLVLAGPFMSSGDLRGIYIFNVSTVKEAEQLTNSDPAIQEGVLKMELMPWYGSAALMGLNDEHKRITKSNIVN